MYKYYSANLISHMSCVSFSQIFINCLIDENNFVRTGNIEVKTEPLTLQKMLMEVNTKAWMKGPNLD